MMSDMVVKAKPPCEAWEVLNSMLEDGDSDQSKDNATKNYETLAMIV